MSYTIDYSTLNGEEKEQAALQDIFNYWYSHTGHYVNLLKQNTYEIRNAPNIFYFSLSFIGIQGYPATVLRKWLLEKPDELDEMVNIYLDKVAKEQEELELMDEDEDE